MRLKTCKHCRAKFQPARADAEFCGNLCRQAAYRVRNGKTAAVRDEEVFQQRDALQAMRDFEGYCSIAATLALQADDINVKDVKFLAVKGGIAVLETTPGAVDRSRHKFAKPGWWPDDAVSWGYYRLEESQRMASDIWNEATETKRAGFQYPPEGRSFIQRECEREGTKALLNLAKRPDAPVLFLKYKPFPAVDDVVRSTSSSRWASLGPWIGRGPWADEYDNDSDVGISQAEVNEWLSGDGFQIEKG